MFRFLRVCVVYLSLLPSVAGECLVDNFDDHDDDGWLHCGDWGERKDPVWDASAGNYCLGLGVPLRAPPPPPLTVMAERALAGEESRFSNGCARVTFSAGTEVAGTWTTHFVMGLRTDCKHGGYKAMLGPSFGRISIYRRLELLADSFDVPFEQGHSYRAEFCAIGEDLSLKVWPLYSVEPREPQLTASNDLFEKGNIALGVFIENDNRGPNVLGCFDDVSFIPSSQCVGDFDCNGQVDRTDLSIIIDAWGSYEPCTRKELQDLDGDCAVGFSDVLALANHWGSCDGS